MLACFRRFLTEPSTLARFLWPNLALSVVIGTLHEISFRLLREIVLSGSDLLQSVHELSGNLNSIPSSIYTPLYKYWIIIAIYGGLMFFRRYRKEKELAKQLVLHNAQIGADLKQAQLLALRMQLQPPSIQN